MEESPRLSAVEYLDRVFEEIRTEARDNPAFAARLVKALGGQVVFSQRHTASLANPIEIAASGGEAGLRETFSNLTDADLRKVMRSAHLATAIDMRGKDGNALLDMLVRRATAKLAERRRS